MIFFYILKSNSILAKLVFKNSFDLTKKRSNHVDEICAKNMLKGLPYGIQTNQNNVPFTFSYKMFYVRKVVLICSSIYLFNILSDLLLNYQVYKYLFKAGRICA